MSKQIAEMVPCCASCRTNASETKEPLPRSVFNVRPWERRKESAQNFDKTHRVQSLSSLPSGTQVSIKDLVRMACVVRPQTGTPSLHNHRNAVGTDLRRNHTDILPITTPRWC